MSFVMCVQFRTAHPAFVPCVICRLTSLYELTA